MIKTKSEQNLGFLTISTIGLGRPTLLALEVAWWRSLAERPPRGMDEAVGPDAALAAAPQGEQRCLISRLPTCPLRTFHGGRYWP